MPDSMIGRYLHARERAVEMGDANLVREVDFQLDRLGYNPGTPEVAEARAEAEAQPRSRPTAKREA